MTRTALLLLLLLGHCSIPHSNVVVVAAICGVGIFASGDLGLLARRYGERRVWGAALAGQALSLPRIVNPTSPVFTRR